MAHPLTTPFLLPPSTTALGSWGVTYPESLQGISGSCVVVPCTLSYPTNVAAGDGIVAIWYKDYDNQKMLVYHSAAQEVDARFKGRAQLLGDPAARNCTLLLRGVTPEDSGPYRFRFEIINGDRWSAAQDVMLSVSGGYGGETPPPQPPACPPHADIPPSALHPQTPSSTRARPPARSKTRGKRPPWSAPHPTSAHRVMLPCAGRAMTPRSPRCLAGSSWTPAGSATT